MNPRRLPVAALAAAVMLLAPATAHAEARAPVVHTETGLVRGFTADGAEKFLGIPYAAPPVGALRWRPPAPARPWRGIRDATRYGNRCPQLPSSNGAGSENEDCLYVNVFRPARLSRRSTPVLVFIHGGGLFNGSGDQHDGALLARSNGIVVVSFIYRLGVFGFLALPALRAEAPDHSAGDYGILDQQAAIRWVHRNIAAFGGDPRRVTIDGESAGGWSVCAQLASPLMRGLFAGAIIQSGSCVSNSLADAENVSAPIAAAAGCPDAATAAGCLRAKSVHDLLAAAADTGVFLLTWGGSELPIAPAQAIATGRFNRVPVINGSNHDEGRTFAHDPGFAGLDEQQYEQFEQDDWGPQAAQVLARYPFAAFPSPYTAAYAIGAIWTDSGAIAGIGGCATLALDRDLARSTRTFAYQFDDRQAPGLNNDLPGYMWGAGHAMELPYLWPSFDNGIPLAAQFTPAQQQLSREMVRRWGAFTRFGTPFWPAYRPGGLIESLRPGGATQPISEAVYRGQHQCDFWDAVTG
jgi:para-nitrobenzyl esterase